MFDHVTLLAAVPAAFAAGLLASGALVLVGANTPRRAVTWACLLGVVAIAGVLQTPAEWWVPKNEFAAERLQRLAVVAAQPQAVAAPATLSELADAMEALPAEKRPVLPAPAHLLSEDQAKSLMSQLATATP